MSTTTLSIPASETAIAEGSSDWSPDELRARVAQEQELRAIIVEYYRSQMIAGKHYYILQAGHKPALGKEGALNLCSLFKVRVSAEDPLESHHDDGHYSVRYRVRLVSMRTGEGVADGDGYCSTRESKYAYRWVKASDLPGNVDTATLAKRSTRYGTQYRVPTMDLADHYNTVLKMSYKRAIVAAALCLPLVSELFTQDIEDTMPTQSPPVQSSKQQQPEQTGHGHTAVQSTDMAPAAQPIEPQQLKQLWSRINHYKIDHEVFRAYLQHIGLESTSQLTPVQLEQCLRVVETRQGQAFQPNAARNTDPDTPAPGTRAQLFDALAMLQAIIAEAEATQPPGEPYAQAIIDLAKWMPRVSRACENPETPEDQLQTYLVEVNDSLEQLQDLVLTTAAA